MSIKINKNMGNQKRCASKNNLGVHCYINKDGISLIVLIITIIIMIILAAAIILSLSKAGIIGNARQAVEDSDIANIKNEVALIRSDIEAELAKGNTALANEIEAAGGMGAYITSKLKNKLPEGAMITNEGEVVLAFDGEVNMPKLGKGMMAVKYDGTKWVKVEAARGNKEWYNYDENVRQWANVVTVNADRREYYEKAAVGTIIEMEDITTMFVWVPRYAYSINEGYYKTQNAYTEEAVNSSNRIDIEFLVGTSNENRTGQTYNTDYSANSVAKGKKTPMIVHPTFNFGGKKLTGIWVAKFEASGNPSNANDFSTYPGNMSSASDSVPTVTEAMYVKVVPNVPSWRNIAIGESQYQSMRMKEDANNVYGFSANQIDTHLMKNNEWGAVAYLCASKYGKTPYINGTYKKAEGGWYYDILTGYNGANATFAYNTATGMKASSTHNVYGIYDIAGGTWERVAAYLDNKNGNLMTYGNSEKEIYFENNELKSEYAKYWDKYTVSDEERNNQIKVGENEIKTQGQIATSNAGTLAWNVARKRITDATYNNMANKKGDAMYEIIGTYSYYGVWQNTISGAWTWHWLLDENSITIDYGRSWNSDYILLSHTSWPFVFRGGYYGADSGAGAFASYINTGYGHYNFGFRPVVVSF